MKKYPKYKDSGIEWIGEIPEGWGKNKLSRVLLIKGRIGWRGYTVNDLRHENDGVLVLGATHINNNGNIDLTKATYLSYEKYNESPEIKLNGGEILIVKVGATVGKIGLVPDNLVKATINPNVMILKEVKIYNKYLFYYLKSKPFQISLVLAKSAGAQDAINQEFVKSLWVSIPEDIEQKTIANYLDDKTHKIDTLIEKKKKQIELLKEQRTAVINQAVTKGLDPNVKMKDSGIEWIGEIPEGWEVKKLKYLSLVQSSNVDKKSFDNEENVLLCNYIDVYKNEFIDRNITFMKATASKNEIDKFKIKPNDVLITKDSETPDDIANPALVIEKLDNLICGYHLAQIRPDNKKLLGKYLFRLFQGKRFNGQFEVYANGITRFGLSIYRFNNAYICIPPLHEQDSIMNYLDKQTSQIDNLIIKIQNQIYYLQEYRTSLISEVVTGKIDVRDYKKDKP